MPDSTHARARSRGSHLLGQPPGSCAAPHCRRLPPQRGGLTHFLLLPAARNPAAKPGPRGPRRQRRRRLRRPLGAREAPGSLRRLAGRGARSHNAAHGASLKRDHDGGGAWAPRSDRSAGERGQSSDGEYTATPAPQHLRASGWLCRARPSRSLSWRPARASREPWKWRRWRWRGAGFSILLSFCLRSPLFLGLSTSPRCLALRSGDGIWY